MKLLISQTGGKMKRNTQLDYMTAQDEIKKHLAALVAIDKKLKELSHELHHHIIHTIECRRALKRMTKGENR